MGQPKTMMIEGKRYKVRYFTQDTGGPVRAVLDVGTCLNVLGVNAPLGGVGPLQGKYGDEWALETLADGTLVLPDGKRLQKKAV